MATASAPTANTPTEATATDAITTGCSGGDAVADNDGVIEIDDVMEDVTDMLGVIDGDSEMLGVMLMEAEGELKAAHCALPFVVTRVVPAAQRHDE
jgi:hypothetical protein